MLTHLLRSELGSSPRYGSALRRPDRARRGGRAPSRRLLLVVLLPNVEDVLLGFGEQDGNLGGIGRQLDWLSPVDQVRHQNVLRRFSQRRSNRGKDFL